jgi:hypothetical protein
MSSKHVSRLSRTAAALACVLSASACLDNQLDEDQVAGDKRVFIAQAGDFLSYEDWTSFERKTTSEHGGAEGTTKIYVSELPDAEKKFPIGTILFKSTQLEGDERPVIHAMTKRGSGFNPRGVLGWEYFELFLGKSGAPLILWRGAEPPSGEQYQQLLGAENLDRPMVGEDGDCNGCHVTGEDGVLGEDLLRLLDE